MLVFSPLDKTYSSYWQGEILETYYFLTFSPEFPNVDGEKYYLKKLFLNTNPQNAYSIC